MLFLLISFFLGIWPKKTWTFLPVPQFFLVSSRQVFSSPSLVFEITIVLFSHAYFFKKFINGFLGLKQMALKKSSDSPVPLFHYMVTSKVNQKKIWTTKINHQTKKRFPRCSLYGQRFSIHTALSQQRFFSYFLSKHKFFWPLPSQHL